MFLFGLSILVNTATAVVGIHEESDLLEKDFRLTKTFIIDNSYNQEGSGRM